MKTCPKCGIDGDPGQDKKNCGLLGCPIPEPVRAQSMTGNLLIEKLRCVGVNKPGTELQIVVRNSSADVLIRGWFNLSQLAEIINQYSGASDDKLRREQVEQERV